MARDNRHVIGYEINEQLLEDFEQSEAGHKYLQTIINAKKFTLKHSHGPNGDLLAYYGAKAVAGDPVGSLWDLFCYGYARGYALGLNKGKEQAKKA